MKISKSLLTAMAVIGFAAAASAQTEVYICGSTAYRGAVTKAIQDVLSANSTGFSFGYDGGSSAKPIYGAGEAIFSGTYNSTYYIVHTYWTGSLAGCVDVSNTNSLPFMADSAGMAPATTEAGGTGAWGGGVNDNGTGYSTISIAPNVAMSDSFASSVNKSLSAEAPALAKNILNLHQAGLNGETVTGVLPFEWVAGAQTSGSAPFSNITQEAASALIQGGYIPLGQLATSPSDTVAGDTNDYVFLIGRNEDSGTRICAQAESQVGSAFGAQSFGRAMVQTYAEFTANTGGVGTDGHFGSSGDGSLNGAAVQTGGTNCTVSDIGFWPPSDPLSTEPSINWNTVGHSGQIGGGDVASVLEALNPLYLNVYQVDQDDGQESAQGDSFPQSPSQPDNWDPAGNGNATDHSNKAYLVGYIGLADAAGIPASSNCRVLTYNGVQYDPSEIQNGTYDFWSFEHMYYLSSASTAVQTFANKLNDKLYTGDCQTDSKGNTDTSVVPNNAVGGLKYTNVHYGRSQEGAAIFQGF